MLKILLIFVLVYLLFRAGRNLLRAAVKDGIVPRTGWQPTGSPPGQHETGRMKNAGGTSGPREIEDAVWEDLP